MTTSLPAAIESYLKEAGFSATEMLIIRKLVEENCLTLRELAGKTGKSTGVLDLAMKKLLQKKIIRKDNINDHPKYCIHSLQSIVQWVNEDMKTRKETLERRHKNFEEFIASLKVDKARPDMEYFQGLEGIQKAYLKLLETGGELLTTTPITTTIEEDPLRAFRVDYFRKRQVRKIFQRILTPNTQLSRRFQSRDPFEYRRTLFLPDSTPDPVFERTVVGSTIACIDFINQTACFIRYPDLAEAERKAFEALWNIQLEHERNNPQSDAVPSPKVPLKTKLFSGLREFLLSKRSLTLFAVFALLSAAISFGLYNSARDINLQRIRDKVMSIAATGVLQFDPSDIAALNVESDYQKPQWTKVIGQLKQIRLSNPDLLFVYIFRKSITHPDGLDFVADSHSINPYANTDNDPTNNVDVNNDGIIDNSGADLLQWPGQYYPNPPYGVMNGFAGATATTGFYVDQWGDAISGYAPLKDGSGSVIAVLAVDMQSNKLTELTNKTFLPLYSFIILFACFVIARAIAWGSSSKRSS
jgi:predicted transcriptional regulator